MRPLEKNTIESKFSSLIAEEKVSIISHGVALCLSEWKKRLFLAESKVRFFEEKYRMPLAELDTKGLPDDADHEMHEDYIMWHHWTEALEKARKKVIDLNAIAIYGVVGEGSYVSICI
ncbi:MAG: hypothetical protein GWP10_15170 [Nitrospiraceae bacterium]|nr:hypothetical protein [Nitrospiraceae bacterium]